MRTVIVILILTTAFASAKAPAAALAKDDGYRGIWYANQPSKDEYRYKYSGGFATYPQQQLPKAIFAKEVNKTFFCYGGRTREKNELLHMVSYFDHTTGTVPRPALVLDSRAEKQLVYLKDLNFDNAGRPVVLFLTTTGYESGPKHGPRPWFTLRWTGTEWVRRPFTTTDHNYDHGSLHIEPDGLWRIIAPTDPGPQPWTAGGEMVMWTSRDEGATWSKAKTLTYDSLRNHTYARRPVNAHPGFYTFWADGHTLEPSESRLYFTDREGSQVWRLPEAMSGDSAPPEPVW